MFGWLANLMLKTPVQNTCSCCEGKREKLENMRRQIETGRLDDDGFQQEENHAGQHCSCQAAATGSVCFSSASLHIRYSSDGTVQAEIRPAKKTGCSCGGNCKCNGGHCRCGS